jgi:hypothetical protein
VPPSFRRRQHEATPFLTGILPLTTELCGALHRACYSITAVDLDKADTLLSAALNARPRIASQAATKQSHAYRPAR